MGSRHRESTRGQVTLRDGRSRMSHDFYVLTFLREITERKHWICSKQAIFRDILLLRILAKNEITSFLQVSHASRTKVPAKERHISQLCTERICSSFYSSDPPRSNNRFTTQKEQLVLASCPISPNIPQIL